MSGAQLAFGELAEDGDGGLEIAGDELDVAERRLAADPKDLVADAVCDRMRRRRADARASSSRPVSASTHAAARSSIPGYCSSPVCSAISRASAACSSARRRAARRTTRPRTSCRASTAARARRRAATAAATNSSNSAARGRARRSRSSGDGGKNAGLSRKNSGSDRSRLDLHAALEQPGRDLQRPRLQKPDAPSATAIVRGSPARSARSSPTAPRRERLGSPRGPTG